MKILHLNTKNDSGGAALVARTLHLDQRNLGLDSTFIAGRGETQTEQNLLTLRQSKLRVLSNVFYFRVAQIEAPLNHTLWTKLWTRDIDSADIIHLHNAHGYYLPHEVLIRLLNKPTVWTLHDNWLLSGRCSFSQNCSGYMSGCVSCPQLDLYPKTWKDKAQESFQKRRALPFEKVQMVTPSHDQKALFVKAGFSENKIEVIHNPITLPHKVLSAEEKRQKRKDVGLKPNRYTLLFSAENVNDPRKSFETVAALSKLLPEPDEYQIIIIGQTKATHDLGIATKYTGLLSSREQMAHYYAMSDVTVIPSREESYGLVGPEALSCGSHVLCNNLPVFRESMGEDALFIANNDPQAYADKITELRHEGAELAPQITKSYCSTLATQKYIALYERVLGQR